MTPTEAVDHILRLIIYKKWMSEQDYNDLVNETLKSLSLTKDQLVSQIMAGVSAGHSIESQIEIIKQILK